MKQEFLNRMKQYLKEEYDAYLLCLQKPLYRGIRVNTSKIGVEDFLQLNTWNLRPSSICPTSFYLEEEKSGIGNHFAHLAGLFYMQEPSASSAVEVLDVKQGDWVLDLCAAPGGKSTQIAAKLNHTGFLLSNEIDGKRAQILLSNMERLGFSEMMITNAHPDVLCAEVKGWFDKVLVDAPCSGEGMFRKHDQAMEDWSEAHVLACAQRQKHILNSAYDTLKEGGTLVYSTCTYAKEENEEVVASFLKEHQDMELVSCDVSFGREGFACEGIKQEYVRRIFPMDEGEGHFIAKMKKHGTSEYSKKKELPSQTIEPYVKAFIEEQLEEMPAYFYVQQDKVYMKQTPFISLKKTKIIRQGVLVGECVKKRIEPHQHFYIANAYPHKAKQIYDMNEQECELFLSGNVLPVSGYKGYVQLCWKGYPLGFGKGDQTCIKNKYPKGLRRKGGSVCY